MCSHSPSNVAPEPQQNVSIAAVRGAVRPSIRLEVNVLTHFILADSSTVILVCRKSPFVILEVSGSFCQFYAIFDGKTC